MPSCVVTAESLQDRSATAHTRCVCSSRITMSSNQCTKQASSGKQQDRSAGHSGLDFFMFASLPLYLPESCSRPGRTGHLLGVLITWSTLEACVQLCDLVPCVRACQGHQAGQKQTFSVLLAASLLSKKLAPSLDDCRREQPEAVRADLSEPLVAGIASHHAGCLPAWKAIVERCFQRGELWPQPRSGKSLWNMRASVQITQVKPHPWPKHRSVEG